MLDWNKIKGFQWDDGNDRKNDKHGVSRAEAEEVFDNEPLMLKADLLHSSLEPRFNAMGRSNAGRLLHITFTLRGDMLRIISARTMHKKERTIYEEET